jgi:D-glycero-D-manno-heptose 1,7-bisphosphate phosphatase
MTNKAIFLDRDGTINVDKGYTHKIEDLKFIPNSVRGLKKLSKSGYKLIVLTNQSGIGRSYYTKEDYFAFRNEMHRKLKEQGVLIIAEYFCPHVSEDNCNCRKPKSGMLEQAAKDFNLDLNQCWVIGDSSRDIQSGKVVGCKAVQVLTGEEKIPATSADFVARDMIEAANIILLENKNK